MSQTGLCDRAGAPNVTPSPRPTVPAVAGWTALPTRVPARGDGRPQDQHAPTSGARPAAPHGHRRAGARSPGRAEPKYGVQIPTRADASHPARRRSGCTAPGAESYSPRSAICDPCPVAPATREQYSSITAWVFVMTLGFGRSMFAEVVFNQKVEIWLALHMRAFDCFGGCSGDRRAQQPQGRGDPRRFQRGWRLGPQPQLPRAGQVLRLQGGSCAASGAQEQGQGRSCGQIRWLGETARASTR